MRKCPYIFQLLLPSGIRFIYDPTILSYEQAFLAATKAYTMGGVAVCIKLTELEKINSNNQNIFPWG